MDLVFEGLRLGWRKPPWNTSISFAVESVYPWRMFSNCSALSEPWGGGYEKTWGRLEVSCAEWFGNWHFG